MLTRTCPPGLALAGPDMTEVRVLVQFRTASGAKLSFWCNFQVILHGFASRNSKKHVYSIKKHYIYIKNGPGPETSRKIRKQSPLIGPFKGALLRALCLWPQGIRGRYPGNARVRVLLRLPCMIKEVMVDCLTEAMPKQWAAFNFEISEAQTVA